MRAITRNVAKRRVTIQLVPILAGLLIVQSLGAIIQLIERLPAIQAIDPYWEPLWIMKQRKAAEYKLADIRSKLAVSADSRFSRDAEERRSELKRQMAELEQEFEQLPQQIHPGELIEHYRQGSIALLFARFMGGVFAATLARGRNLAHSLLVAVALLPIDIASTYSLYREVDELSHIAVRMPDDRLLDADISTNGLLVSNRSESRSRDQLDDQSAGDAVNRSRFVPVRFAMLKIATQHQLQTQDEPEVEPAPDFERRTSPPSNDPPRAKRSQCLMWATLAVLAPFTPRNWLNVIVVIFGGYAVVAHASWRWQIAARRSWRYVTSKGGSIPVHSPPSDRVLAFVWSLSGALLVLTCWMPFLEPPTLQDVGSTFYLCSWASLRWGAAGVACWLLARRYRPHSVDRVLESDPRSPVVFLRSFGDDGLLAMRGFGIDYLVRWLLHRTAERRLASLVQQIGPFVAIGRPGELLPDIGAARVYVADEHWKEVVEDLASRSSLIIFQAGQTPGLKWELAMVKGRVSAEKVLVFLPFPSNRYLLPCWNRLDSCRREKYYHRFLSWAEPCLGVKLPDQVGDLFFLAFFARDNQLTDWNVRRILPGRKTRPDHPLSQLLERLAADRVFRRPNLRGRMLHGAAVIVLGLLGTILQWPDFDSQRRALRMPDESRLAPKTPSARIDENTNRESHAGEDARSIEMPIDLELNVEPSVTPKQN